MKHSLDRFMITWSRSVIVSICLAIAVAAILLLGLHSLIPGFHSQEIAARNASQSLGAIADNPLFAPHKLLSYAIQSLTPTHGVGIRTASAIFGFISAGLFYFIVKKWHSHRITFLATSLMVTSSWFLHHARFAGPEIAYTTAILALIAIGLWFRDYHRRTVALIVSLVIMSAILYIPAMVYIVIVCVIWQRKLIFNELRHIPAPLIVAGIAAQGLVMAPLIVAAIYNPQILLSWLGLPQQLPEINTVLVNFARIPLSIIARSPGDPAYNVGNMPLLDVFTAVMVLLGMYARRLYIKAHRTLFIAAAGLFLSVMIAIEGGVTLISLLPFVYFMAANGISLMLQQWLTVFPKNPFARTLGASMVTVAVALAGFYHINQYFIAWPNTPATREAYSEKI